MPALQAIHSESRIALRRLETETLRKWLTEARSAFFENVCPHFYSVFIKFFFALPSDRRFLIWTTSNRSLGYKSRSLSYQQFRFIFGKKNGNTPALWANNSYDLTTFIHSFQIIPQTFRALNRSRNIKNTHRDFAYVSVGPSLYLFHVNMTALSLSLNWVFWRAIVSL